MGALYEFNWLLKLPNIDEQQLCVDKSFHFSKSGIRVYPINIPVDLVNNHWETVARCIITQITISSQETTGEYTIVEIYDETKRKILTEHLRNLLKIVKNQPDISSYDEIHIT